MKLSQNRSVVIASNLLRAAIAIRKGADPEDALVAVTAKTFNLHRYLGQAVGQAVRWDVYDTDEYTALDLVLHGYSDQPWFGFVIGTLARQSVDEVLRTFEEAASLVLSAPYNL